MKKLISLLLLSLGFFLFSGVASAAPKNLKKHALAKVLLAPAVVVKHSPTVVAKAMQMTGKGVSYTIGGVFFAAESGVDVVHLATDVLDKGVAAEGWKRNFFHYPNVVVGYADSGLEDLYQTFFGLKI